MAKKRRCSECDEVFIPAKPNYKYCDECREEVFARFKKSKQHKAAQSDEAPQRKVRKVGSKFGARKKLRKKLSSDQPVKRTLAKESPAKIKPIGRKAEVRLSFEVEEAWLTQLVAPLANQIEALVVSGKPSTAEIEVKRLSARLRDMEYELGQLRKKLTSESEEDSSDSVDEGDDPDFEDEVKEDAETAEDKDDLESENEEEDEFEDDPEDDEEIEDDDDTVDLSDEDKADEDDLFEDPSI